MEALIAKWLPRPAMSAAAECVAGPHLQRPRFNIRCTMSLFLEWGRRTAV
jgi:hypothetical protein